MTLQAINAQALRPAVNFKANEKAETSAATATADAPAKENKHTALKVLGGATALALLGFGIYKMAKGKGAGNTKKAAQELLEKRNATMTSYQKQNLMNNESVKKANNIVSDFEAMQRRLTDHNQFDVEYKALNWDATPLKRSEVIDGLKKEAAEAAKKSAEEFAAKVAQKA